MILVVYMIFRISGGYSKKRAQNIPVVFPTPDAGWVLLAPDFREVPQILLGFFQRDSGIDFFQVGDYAFEILVADIFRGTADLMDDAALQAGFLGYTAWIACIIPHRPSVQNR